MTEKKAKATRSSDFMSVAEATRYMDRWATQLNERHEARQNLRNVVADFRAYLEDEGEDPDHLSADQIKGLWTQMVTDAATRQKKRLHDPRRGRTKVPKEIVLMAFDKEKASPWHDASDSAYARKVAKQMFRDKQGRVLCDAKGRALHVGTSTIMAYLKERRDHGQ